MCGCEGWYGQECNGVALTIIFISILIMTILAMVILFRRGAWRVAVVLGRAFVSLGFSGLWICFGCVGIEAYVF